MSVLIEAINVIIRNATIEKKYRGGLSRFQSEKNRTFCTDGRIARLGFMVSVDAARFITDLEKRGFVHARDDQCIDIAVVSQRGDFLVP